MAFVRVTVGPIKGESRPRFSTSRNFYPDKTQLISHNLNSHDVLVQCYTNNGKIDPADLIIVDENKVRLKFNTATTVKILIG